MIKKFFVLFVPVFAMVGNDNHSSDPDSDDSTKTHKMATRHIPTPAVRAVSVMLTNRGFVITITGQTAITLNRQQMIELLISLGLLKNTNIRTISNEDIAQEFMNFCANDDNRSRAISTLGAAM